MSDRWLKSGPSLSALEEGGINIPDSEILHTIDVEGLMRRTMVDRNKLPIEEIKPHPMRVGGYHNPLGLSSDRWYIMRSYDERFGRDQYSIVWVIKLDEGWFPTGQYYSDIVPYVEEWPDEDWVDDMYSYTFWRGQGAWEGHAFKLTESNPWQGPSSRHWGKPTKQNWFPNIEVWEIQNLFHHEFMNWTQNPLGVKE